MPKASLQQSRSPPFAPRRGALLSVCGWMSGRIASGEVKLLAALPNLPMSVAWIAARNGIRQSEQSARLQLQAIQPEEIVVSGKQLTDARTHPILPTNSHRSRNRPDRSQKTMTLAHYFPSESQADGDAAPGRSRRGSRSARRCSLRLGTRSLRSPASLNTQFALNPI